MITLIPSATYATVELTAEYGHLPPTFLPIGHSRLYELQVNLIHQHNNSDIYITLPINFVPNKYDLDWLGERNIRIIKIDDSISFISAVNKQNAGTELLKVDSVLMQFGGLKALNNVDLSIKRGNIHGLIGPNGSGKSTFYRLALEPLGLPFVNADLLARIVFTDAPEMHSYEAAQLAERQRFHLLQEGVSFCFETVYSHPSKIDFLARAKGLGYQIIMVLIHLDSSDLNQARVACRVSEGGHGVAAEKVVARIPRLLEQVRLSIPLLDLLRVYDNSSALDPFQPVLTINNGEIILHRDPLPGWAAALLADRSAS
jgi:predicted ABC-type ATPase